MGTILYSRTSKQVSYEGLDGVVGFPKHPPELDTSNVLVSYPMECILGVLTTSGAKYLFFCSNSELVGAFDDAPIHRILKVRYLPLNDRVCDDEAESVRSLIESLRFYYAFENIEEHFLWNGEMLRQFEEMLDSTMSKDMQSRASQYIFKTAKGASSCRSPFTAKARTDSLPPVVEKSMKSLLAGRMFCGYFEAQTVRESGCLYFLKIQSRISIKKIGTRMLSRGVDELGKVSFFVETKFAIEGGGERNEFTVLRGSVPVYWSQDDPLKPYKMNLERDYESNQKAFKSHFDKLQQGYGKIVVVDLLGNKKYEKMLSKLYRDLCTENGIDYIHFDLNHHTENFNVLKSLFHDKLAKTLDRIQEGIAGKQPDAEKSPESVADGFGLGLGSFINQSFNVSSSFDSLVDSIIPSDQLVSGSEKDSSSDDENGWEDQDSSSAHEVWHGPDSTIFPGGECFGAQSFRNAKVVFRVNCVDCLDRTNIGQFLIFNFSQKHRFRVIKSMWANNGDALSNMYTGSDALKSELPSKGSISVFGRLNDLVISANRMLNNRFTDKDKQQAIDLLLGRKSS